MFNSLYFDIAAIAILICILSLHLLNQNKLMLQSRTFTWMILTTLFASIADILDVYGSAHAFQFPMVYHQATSYAYFLMLNSTPFTYAFYTVSLKKNHLSVFNRIEKSYCLFLFWFFILLSFLTSSRTVFSIMMPICNTIEAHTSSFYIRFLFTTCFLVQFILLYLCEKI